ncbi:MAG: DUF4294 domain-containing protein [Ginsengibacter sp.]
MRTCYNIRVLLPVALVLVCLHSKGQQVIPQNTYDTLLTQAVVYNGDTLEAKMLAGVYVWTKRSKPEWTRLRNAVYVTYPYAIKAAFVFNDIESHISNNKDKQAISKYINSREKELKKEFSDPLKNLSVYQGKVLMKLINRQTGGTNCYDILKELKGGFTARLWQTVAFFFGSDLKQPYDAYGKDAEMEVIVLEVRRMYGYPS